MRLAKAAVVACLAVGGVAEARTLPWGAEAQGNRDGSIPAWTGPKGIRTLHDGRLLDPFPNDAPIFVIDQSNYLEYERNLSRGQIAMLRRYPSYSIPVFKTRRIFDLPDWGKAAIAREASGTSLVGDQGLKGLNESTVPFPKPTNGLEAIWNHIVRFRGATVFRASFTAPVQRGGQSTMSFTEEKILFRRGLRNNRDNANTLFKYLNAAKAPARLQGQIVLVHEFMDQVIEPRNAWLYNSGSRRVRRVPTLSYDAPLEFSDAGATNDDYDMYNGAPDKYTWGLLGKREMYVPANGFRFGAVASVDTLVQRGHLNPRFARYEKRRVWVVEATLKPSERHIYGRRVFYLDEDGWTAVLADQYDARGELWRVKELHSVFISQNKATFGAAEAIYDLKTGGYLGLGLLAGVRARVRFDRTIKESEFTPGSLRRKGR